MPEPRFGAQLGEERAKAAGVRAENGVLKRRAEQAAEAAAAAKRQAAANAAERDALQQVSLCLLMASYKELWRLVFYVEWALGHPRSEGAAAGASIILGRHSQRCYQLIAMYGPNSFHTQRLPACCAAPEGRSAWCRGQHRRQLRLVPLTNCTDHSRRAAPTIRVGCYTCRPWSAWRLRAPPHRPVMLQRAATPPARSRP